MGKAINLLKTALIAIVDDGNLMLKDDFMMSIFKLIADKVPDFEEHLDYMLEQNETPTITKHQSNINEFNNSKVLPYDLLRAELFYPQREENKAIDTMCARMAVELATTMLIELRDPHKATSDYLSSAKGEFSWGETSQEEHEAPLPV